MNFIRASLLERRHAQEHGMPDHEHQIPIVVEGRRQTSSRLFTVTRPAFPGPVAEEGDDESEGDGALEAPSANDLRIPSRTRSGAIDMLNQLPSEDGIRGSESASQPSTTCARTRRFPVLTRPPTAWMNGREPVRPVRRSRFDGSDLADLYLTNVAESERPRHHAHRGQGSSGRSRRRQQKDPPKRFLFCFPWVKSRRARSLILRCFVSGSFVTLSLIIYLSLTLTKNINTNEFNILLVLPILLATIWFCHALIRLCVLLMQPRKRSGSSGNGSEMNVDAQSKYAIPQHPIRVIVPQDEEVAGIESEVTKPKPPAYGLWRESVRVDPSRLYWQRADPPASSQTTSTLSSKWNSNERSQSCNAQHRPPSYASDDGVEYVLDARPRSIAPPPSSVYSQSSMARATMTSNMTYKAPPPPLLLPYRGMSDPARPGNLSMV
ncbi:hypothetical protein GGS21DRAFT_403952 [Xylaria nigripes]|nr:hypothetical protein GGS21DRAFT_403952 [Xylaria nigripes]